MRDSPQGAYLVALSYLLTLNLNGPLSVKPHLISASFLICPWQFLEISIIVIPCWIAFVCLHVCNHFTEKL